MQFKGPSLKPFNPAEAQQRWREGSTAFGDFIETEARELSSLPHKWQFCGQARQMNIAIAVTV